MKMKIVHIVESFAGGVYDFLVNLINNFPDMKHVVIYGKRDNTPENFEIYFPNNVTFIHWKNAIREVHIIKDLFALYELLNILKPIVRDIDIIHLHSSKAGFLGRIMANLLNMESKVIYTPHGVSFLRKDVSKVKQKLFLFLEILASKFGGMIIACSKSEAEEFNKYAIKADFIYNGIECNSLKDKIPRYRNSFILGTIGRITYPKNPELFNRVAKKFENNDIKFLWIGSGELENALTSKNIKITGWLPQNELWKELEEIDLYISTSLWEGLPLSVLQAMCAEKPLVLFNCVGNRDLVWNGVNGYLAYSEKDFFRLISSILNDRKKLVKFGKRSKFIFMAKFTLKRTIDKYKRLYNNIAQSNRKKLMRL